MLDLLIRVAMDGVREIIDFFSCVLLIQPALPFLPRLAKDYTDMKTRKALEIAEITVS